MVGKLIPVLPTYKSIKNVWMIPGKTDQDHSEKGVFRETLAEESLLKKKVFWLWWQKACVETETESCTGK